MLTILSIIGTRPEAIKMAPVVKELQRRSTGIRSIVCATAQHRQMLDQVLELFQLRPDYDLNLMQSGQSLSLLTAGLVTGLDKVISAVQPDWVLAQGDTTTTMVAGLTAFYNGVRFGHVEAGLRTGNRRHPFPEEVNRRIADTVADLYFAPTAGARDQLLLEHVPGHKIVVTGNTGIDALLMISRRPYDWNGGPLANINMNKRLVLVTAHRRENFGEPLRDLSSAIRTLAGEFAEKNVHFVFPVHPNPEVGNVVREFLSNLGNVSLLEPLSYVDMVNLMRRSVVILTDSGGIQEEAPTFGVPVLVMRDTTERSEGIEAGVARLVGTSRERIVEEVTRLLTDSLARAAMIAVKNPYGDGHAAERIVTALLTEAG